MNGKDINAVLEEFSYENFSEGNWQEIWRSMPEYAHGPRWSLVIRYIADAMGECVFSNTDYEDDYLTIAKECDELDLWAHEDIDAEAQEIGGGVYKNMRQLQSLYLYVAYSQVGRAIANYIQSKVNELQTSQK